MVSGRKSPKKNPFASGINGFNRLAAFVKEKSPGYHLSLTLWWMKI
jgi:hypothetical protein